MLIPDFCFKLFSCLKTAKVTYCGPRDAAVNFDTYRILQRHRAVSLPLHDFLVYISDLSNAEITHTTLIFTAVTQSRKSRHTTKIKKSRKSHGDHEYVIIL